MGPPANNQRCEWNRVWCSKLTRLLRGGHSRFSRLDSHGNCQNHEGKRNHHRLASRCRRRHFSANTKIKRSFVWSFVFCFKCSKIWFLSTKVHWVYIFYLNILCVFFFWLLTRVVRLVRCSSNIRYPRQTDTAHCSLSAISLAVYLFLFLFVPICQYETIWDVGLFLFCSSSSSLCCRSTGCRMTQSLPTRSANLVVVDEEQMARACFKSQIIDEQISSLNDGNQTSGNLSCQFVGVT